LSANFDMATGEVVAPTRGPRRTEEDVAAPIAQTMAPDPEAPWLVIVDQLTTQKSEALVRLVARVCGSKEELGEQEKRGLWQSRPTRAAFLRETSHRSRLLSTPKHSRWLNHIELWGSMLGRRWLKRGNFTAVVDLRERLLAFIAYCNKTMATPFKWTYTGRPLTV
jgi:hypothetical protein